MAADPRQMELIIEHAVAHMPASTTARMLGIEPEALATWAAWLEKGRRPHRPRPPRPRCWCRKPHPRRYWRFREISRPNARALARLLHAELQASAIRKPAPKTRSGSPGSKADPRSRNPSPDRPVRRRAPCAVGEAAIDFSTTNFMVCLP